MSKSEIAVHYQIGIRTVTKLMQKKILPYTKVRNLVRFDVVRCDGAIEFFETSSVVSNGCGRLEKGQVVARIWKTKRQVGEHISVSERSVTTLMRKKILPYVKIGRLVRLDLSKCKRVLNALGTRSIVEDHLG